MNFAPWVDVDAPSDAHRLTGEIRAWLAHHVLVIKPRVARVSALPLGWCGNGGRGRRWGMAAFATSWDARPYAPIVVPLRVSAPLYLFA